MITITNVQKDRNKTIFTSEDSEGNITHHILQDGMLESYMGVWGTPAGATLTALLGDAMFDWFDPPLMGDMERLAEFEKDLARAEEEIAWSIDRDQALADITLADDDAELVRSTWAHRTAEVVANGIPESPTMVETLRAQRDMELAYAAENERLQEERLADDFVSSLPTELLTAPRNGESTETSTPTVGLAIQFVP